MSDVFCDLVTSIGIKAKVQSSWTTTCIVVEQGDGTFGSSTEQVTYEMYVVTEALLSLHSWGRSTGIDEVLKLAATR